MSASTTHTVLLKCAQCKLPCFAAVCLLVLLHANLAVPPAASPGPFRRARSLNLSLTSPSSFYHTLRTQSWPLSLPPACSIGIFKLSLFKSVNVLIDLLILKVLFTSIPFKALNTVFKTILISVLCLPVSTFFLCFFPQQWTFHSLYVNVSFVHPLLLQSAKVTGYTQLSSIRLYYKHPDILRK